jgi:hypothetical protein
MRLLATLQRRAGEDGASTEKCVAQQKTIDSFSHKQ